MPITKLIAGAKGSPTNSSGPEIADSVNALIDTNVNGIKNLPVSANANVVYKVQGFYADSVKGGGDFIWSATTNKNTHNGGTIIAPEAIAAWDGTQANISAILSWTGTGSGCWLRTVSDEVSFYNFGAVLDAVKSTGAGSDDTLAVQKALSTGVDIFFPRGFCKLTDRVAMVNLSKLHGVDRNSSMFVIGPDFNMSATGVLKLGTTEPASTVLDVGFSFVQADQSVRANVTQYPWAIDAAALPRFAMDRIRIEGAWNGVNATGNSGGSSTGLIEIGALNIGMEYDGSADFVHLGNLHFWPFGMSSKTNLLNVYYDTNTTSLKLGRVDGLDLGSVSMFRTKMIITSAATVGIPNQIGKLQLDGDGARLIVQGGVVNVAQMYSTKSVAATVASLEVSAGTITVDDLHYVGTSPVPDVVVSGGNLDIQGGMYSAYNSLTSNATVSSGNLRMANMRFRVNATATYAQPMILQSGTGSLVFTSNKFDARVAGSGVAVSCTVDAAANFIQGNKLSGYTFSNPTTASLGTYQGSLSYTPVITGATVAGAGTYSVQDGKYETISEKLVMFTASITWSAHTGSGGMRVSLPHNLGDFGQRVALNVYYTDLAVGASKEVGAFVGQSGNVLAIRALDPAGGGVVEFFDTAGTINISGFYRRA